MSDVLLIDNNILAVGENDQAGTVEMFLGIEK